MKNKVVDPYFRWLYHKVDADKQEFSYKKLLEILHKKEFYWTVNNDDNRCEDGKELRLRFKEEAREETIDYLNKPCSVLEVLVALMFRFDELMFEPETEEEEKRRPAKWFWEMLDNVYLTKYTDEVYNKHDYRIDIDEILNSILGRMYGRDGVGGLFPLENPKKNQRKVELWYQMNAYIMEKCYTSEC